MRFIVLTLLTTLMFPLSAFSEKAAHALPQFSRLTTKEGLHNDNVLHILQLSDGRMAVTNYNCINLIDGDSIRQLPFNSPQEYRISNYHGAYHVYADEDGFAAMAPVFTKEMRRLFRKRVFDVAGAYGEIADSWDVVNESAQDWVRYRKARTGLPVWFSNYGLMPGDYPLHALLDAKEAFPASARLAINDYKIDDSFLEQTRQLVDEGARIDIVGCQMHIFNTNDCTRLVNGATDVKWVGTPQTIRARLDMMARTGRPLHVSEVTIAAPGEDARSRDIQAVLVRNIYRAWFSHPAAMGITWWNTVDGAGVAGEPLVSGLFTRDMEKKPAYHALDQLINHEWKTSLDAKASAGKVAFRGFRGRYRLTWKGADGKPRAKTVELK